MSKKAGAAAPRVYVPGEVVLAKVKGYPSWPGQVVSLDSVPPKVTSDKSFRVKNTTIVQFFPKGDYGAFAGRDVSPITSIEIDAFIARSKKSTEIVEGYKIAADPTAWNDMRAQGLLAYDEALAAMEEDELESGGEDGGEGDDKEKVKKRKRKSETGEKAPKEDKKVKKAKLEKMAKGRSKATAAYSEDEGEPSSKKSKASKEDKDDSPGLKQVKDWRHKLQRSFLPKEELSGDEMAKCDEYFKAMETFEMRTDWLAISKLGKVLKHIHNLADGRIPREAEFDFRGRAAALATRWAAGLGGSALPENSNGAPAPADVEMVDAPAPVVDAPAPAVVPEVVAEVPAVVVEEKVAEVATNGAAEIPAVVEPVVANGAAVEAPIVEAPVVEEAKVEEPKIEEVAVPAPAEPVVV